VENVLCGLLETLGIKSKHVFGLAHEHTFTYFYIRTSFQSLNVMSCVLPFLAGYTHKITGKTAEERLDLRASSKADKFCK